MQKFWRLIAATCTVFFFARGASAYAHTAYGSTTMSVTPNPVQLVSGPDVTISTTTISIDSLFSSAHPEQVDNGYIVIQVAEDALGKPVASASAVTWVPLDPVGQHPVGGNTTTSIDLDALGFIPGTVGGVRAEYVAGPGPDNVGAHDSPAVDIVAVQAPDPPALCSGTGVILVADLAGGNGTPPPGFSTDSSGKPFAFAIKVENCTGVDLSGIKIQGGTNGWTWLKSVIVSAGTYTVKQNTKNQVITWNLDLPRNTEQVLTVALGANIPSSAGCSLDPNNPDSDSVRYLSGAWSAVYNAGTGPQKTDYTGRVTVVVTCP